MEFKVGDIVKVRGSYDIERIGEPINQFRVETIQLCSFGSNPELQTLVEVAGYTGLKHFFWADYLELYDPYYIVKELGYSNSDVSRINELNDEV